MSGEPKRALKTLAEIKAYFAESNAPLFFISATNFNVMGMHDWVRGWQNITLIDCYDGTHPAVLNIADDHTQLFESIEDINAYLLADPAVRDLVAARQRDTGAPGSAMFLFFDEKIEAMCEALGLKVILPHNRLVREIDSKIVTTEIGNQAGVPSVPNVLARVESWASLRRIADENNLGDRLVVQTAYGDSGKTTFFIDNEDDYREVAEDIEGEEKVKVMRRIRCAGTAIEACATYAGTFVGPLLTELIGAEKLTPYAGGWCGNELYADSFTPEVRRDVLQKSRAMGDALYSRGYRGYFELDYLVDLDNGDVWLGELNARITGISAMTNLSDFSAENIPLLLFHLLEYDDDVDLQVSPDEFNAAVLATGAEGVASQVILKYTDDMLKIVTDAPVTGVYAMNADGALVLQRRSYNRRDALADSEAFVLRITPAGEYAYHGGDLAIMFLNRVIRDANGTLNATGDAWVDALKNLFTYRNLTAEERAAVEYARNPATAKTGRESGGGAS